MRAKTSPGGSLFPYYYKNGELYGLHLGSFFRDEEGVIARIKAETDFFLEQHHPLGIWIDFYQTKLTDRVLEEFINFLRSTQASIIKLGIVGCSAWDKRKIQNRLKKAGCLSVFPVRYFRDPEIAKSWLIGERV